MPKDSEEELGYRILNPDAPPSEPRKFEALDPEHQEKGLEILATLAKKWRSEGK